MNFSDSELKTKVSDRSQNLVEKILERGSSSQVVLLYGAEGSDLEHIASQLCGRWLSGSDVVADIKRSVDCEVFSPVGASNWIPIHAFVERSQPPSPYELVPSKRFFMTRPLMFDTKVVWFRDVDRLTKDAGNAALKMLEELPNYARVVMTTHHFARVMPTIRSRSLAIACESPEREDGVDEIAVLGDLGNLTPILRAERECFVEVLQLLEGYLAGDRVDPLRASEIARGAAAQVAANQDLKARRANLLVIQAIGNWVSRKLPGKPDKIQFVTECYRALQGNVSPGLVFDNLFVKLFTK